MPSVERWALSAATASRPPSRRRSVQRFPFGTLVVNVAGSFAMGWLFVLFAERVHIPPEMRLLIMTGLLGAFTTFSTFSVETLALLQAGRWLAAAANVLLSVALCLCAAGLGMSLGR